MAGRPYPQQARHAVHVNDCKAVSPLNATTTRCYYHWVAAGQGQLGSRVSTHIHRTHAHAHSVAAKHFDMSSTTGMGRTSKGKQVQRTVAPGARNMATNRFRCVAGSSPTTATAKPTPPGVPGATPQHKAKEHAGMYVACMLFQAPRNTYTLHSPRAARTSLQHLPLNYGTLSSRSTSRRPAASAELRRKAQEGRDGQTSSPRPRGRAAAAAGYTGRANPTG